MKQLNFLNATNNGAQLAPVNEEVAGQSQNSDKSGSFKDMDAFLLDGSGGDKAGKME